MGSIRNPAELRYPRYVAVGAVSSVRLIQGPLVLIWTLPSQKASLAFLAVHHSRLAYVSSSRRCDRWTYKEIVRGPCLASVAELNAASRIPPIDVVHEKALCSDTMAVAICRPRAKVRAIRSRKASLILLSGHLKPGIVLQHPSQHLDLSSCLS